MTTPSSTTIPIPAPEPPRKIQLNRISHVYYTYKDLTTQHSFLLDFGFSVASRSEGKTYYRGYGTSPFLLCATQGDSDAFAGAAWVVDSLSDLELATTLLPNASPIIDSPAPGGGKIVTFYDPVDKFPFHLVYGQTPVEFIETFLELEYNFPTAKHRAVNKSQRFQRGPAPIHKLGHFGLCVTNFAAAFEFYTTYFNLKPSDIITSPSTGQDITVFLHLDRGKEQVDHHSFFFFEGPKFHVHHSSFEVFDFDVQMLGHTWLREKGYENCWGVGRHVLGSQIFDYWFDGAGFILEHYVDGDLVDDTTPIQRSEAGPDNLHVWGPELPATFLA